MKFHDIVRDIKTLKIQGAEHIAREGVRSLLLILQESHAVTRESLLAELYHARDLLVAARPTEPCLRNALTYVFENIYSTTDDTIFSHVLTQRIQEALVFFSAAQIRIAVLGATKIRHHSIIYTHCHSSTVVAILLEAKKQGKKFVVHNTETRPLFQGRITAIQLAKAGISVKHFVDGAAGIAMKDAHLCLFGGDAITSYAVYNKIGSGIFAELASKRDIPLYICSNSWKNDPFATRVHKEVVEERESSEVWKDAPSFVDVQDPAFEAIIYPHIHSIISELGILTPSTFLKTVKQKYFWMYKKR